MSRRRKAREERDSTRSVWLANGRTIAVLAGAIGLVYGQILGFGFLRWDDPLHVLDNPYLNPPALSRIGHFWQHPYEGMYIPVSYTLFTLEALVAYRPGLTGGTFEPSVFHAGSLLLHLACGLLVLAILRDVVRHTGAALCGALLFVLHPLQVESVAWISETRGLLSGVLSCLSIWLYLRFLSGRAEPVDPGDHLQLARKTSAEDVNAAGRSSLLYGAATTAFVLALLAKPSAVSVPLIALAITVAVGKPPLRAQLLPLGFWLFLGALTMIVTRTQQSDEGVRFVAEWWSRPIIAGDALAFYLQKLCVPFGLGFDYGRSPETVLQGGWWQLLGLAPIAFGLLLWRLPNRRRWLAAYGIFVAGVAPVLGLIPFHFQRYSTVSDRYAYLSLLGLALAVAFLLSQYWNTRWRRVAVAVCIGFAAASAWQTTHWGSDQQLCEHNLRINPRSYVSYNNLGQILAARGEQAQAIRYYEQALHVAPDFVESHVNLGVALAAQGKSEPAIEQFRIALRLRPQDPDAHYNLANGLAEQGQRVAAVDEYLAALRSRPRFPDAHFNLAVTLEEQGNLPAAVREYRAANTQRPGFPSYLNGLGAALAQSGQWREAVSCFREALRIDPHNADAQRNLQAAGQMPRR